MLKRKNFLVFSLPRQWANLHSISHQLEWVWLDCNTLALFFSPKEKRRAVFERFIVKGFMGIVWHEGGKWASYAWMSLPETQGPPHLPRWIRRLPVYWIFYCRTKKEYQGRGLFKASLFLLCQWARERDPNAEIYIDTEPNNIPSRRAIEAVGFVPAGLITTWTLSFPKIGSFVICGHWDRKASHKEVSGNE